MALRLYNTLSKQKEIFEPVNPGRVGIYVCGPTVYKDSHIGHAVGPVIFDSLKKFLTYKGYDVTLVINITDVDDKLIIEAKSRGMSVRELAAEVSASYFDAMDLLGVDSIDLYPRATDHINEIIHLIQQLAENGAAYAVDGDVYCDISKVKDYGKLSHRDCTEQIEGSRQLEGSGKRNAADFALWKKADKSEIGWDSPWGYGRPGWHIECSAMSMKYLGGTFDIHGGGLDLVFPHHENEIAQSETATCQPFAKYWMHNGLTRVKTKAASGDWKTEKMSKSLGNIKTLKSLLAEVPPAVIRFFLLSTHYRRPIDFTEESIVATQKGMMNIYRTLDRLSRVSKSNPYGSGFDAKVFGEALNFDADRQLFEDITACQLSFLEALDDDFNTAGAIATLYDLCSIVNKFIDDHQLESAASAKAKTLISQCGYMITSLGKIIGLFTGPLQVGHNTDELAGQLMEIMIELRANARKEKNFALADMIRDRLKAIEIVIEDRPEGTTWSRN